MADKFEIIKVTGFLLSKGVLKMFLYYKSNLTNKIGISILLMSNNLFFIIYHLAGKDFFHFLF